MRVDDETTAVQLQGVLYNGKGRSVFISFHENRTIALYCHILYLTMHCDGLMQGFLLQIGQLFSTV